MFEPPEGHSVRKPQYRKNEAITYGQLQKIIIVQSGRTFDIQSFALKNVFTTISKLENLQ